MPEIKHTFLAGKMNKSLDDRLVPEGEYRDANNIEVTTDIFGSGDIGTVRKIKGNTALTSVDNDFSGTPEVIGSFFDDKNNAIYYFATDNNTHKIYRYTSSGIETLVEGAFLNFNKNNKITGVNVIEDYLFWTDNLNQPRRINIKNPIDYDEEHQISVAKLAPTQAPGITALTQTSTDVNNGEAIAGSYMKEKFIRFSYRLKYTDNTYSVLAPFSGTVFSPREIGPSENPAYIVLTEAEIASAYSSSELSWFDNKINRVQIEVFAPDGKTFSNAEVKFVEILGKSSDSPAVYVLDIVQIDATKESQTSFTHTYLGTNPKLTLSEEQLIRVYDKVPLKALSQEITGNRIVYGNYQENLPLSISSVKASAVLNFSSSGYPLNSFSLKRNRTYEVGVILFDKYGRTSPVITLDNGKVFYEVTENTFQRRNLEVVFENDTQTNDVVGQINSMINDGWEYMGFVVKQDKQEYYNIYTPGFGHVDGKSYFSVFADNINKIPIDTSTYNAETNINTTTQKVYASVINNSLFGRSLIEGTDITETVQEYDVEPFVDNAQMSNYVPIQAYDNVSESWTFDGTTASFQISALATTDADLGFDIRNYHTFVRVYVNGVQYTTAPPVQFSYNASTRTITFNTGYIPEAGDSVVLFAEYDGIPMGQAGNSRSIYSFKEPRATTANLKVDETPNTTDVALVSSSYGGSEFDNEPSLLPFAYGNNAELKITGISTLNNFKTINDDIINASEDLFGIYKKENNYLLAEVDGIYGPLYYDDPNGKYADLAILETPGFESAIDIYFETPKHVKLTDLLQSVDNGLGNPVTIDILYYNAITLAAARDFTVTYWQESRLKGGFNEPFIDFGVQAYAVNPDYNEGIRSSSLIYSGIYNPRTGVNNTNQFPVGENIEKSLDPVYGSIQKLFAEDNDLLVFQEEKVSQIPIDRDVIYTAEGSPQLTTSNRVFGDVIPYAGNFGIGKNPESFAHYAGRKYFVDEPKGAVLRLSRDGITEISNYGMRTYLLQFLTGSSDIYGMWDMNKRQYVLSYQGGLIGQTLSFDESSNGWVSFYDYLPEFGGSLDGQFYTFKNGLLYKHYDGSNFYGQSFDASIQLIMNQNPSASKNFLTINYEGANSWDITSINTDIDSAKDILAYNNTKQDTDTEMYLNIFRNFDGKYFANIINDSNPEANEISFGSSISGVKGHFLNITLRNSNAGAELFSVSTNYNINSY